MFLIPLRTHNADKGVVYLQRKSISGTTIKNSRHGKNKSITFLVLDETGDVTNNEKRFCNAINTKKRPLFEVCVTVLWENYFLKIFVSGSS